MRDVCRENTRFSKENKLYIWVLIVPEPVPEVIGDGDREEELEAVEDAATQVQVLDLSQQGGEVAYMVVKLRSSLRIGLE